MHIFIATPCRDGLAGEMVESLERACAALRSRGHVTERCIEMRGGVVVARNLLAARFLRSGADVLFFVDADVAGFTAEDMFRMLGSGEHVVGGPVPGRSFEPDRLKRAIDAGVPIDDHLVEHVAPLLMWQREGGARTKGSLIEVEGIGTGFLAISREALLAVGESLPLTFLDTEPLKNVFDFTAAPGGQLVGEDLGFSRRWRALGGTVWADTRTQLAHYGRFRFQAPPLASRLVAHDPTRARAPDDRPTRKPSEVDLVGFECPEALRGDALAVARGEYELAAAVFTRAPVVLDIGANVGAFARWALARWPGARVVCYEPHPALFPILERNVGSVAIVKDRAIGREDGEAQLTAGTINACQSTLHADIAAAQGDPEKGTWTVTVQDAASLPACDVLKLDTEGSELEILERYLPAMAPANRPSLVMLEFHRREDRRKIEDLCLSHGFVLVQATVRAPHSGLMWFARIEAARVATA